MSYILCFYSGINIIILRLPNLREIKVLFDTGFTVVIIILFSVWAFNCFKKFNFLCLVDQIKDVRSHCLNIKDTIYLLFALCCAGTVLILLNFNFFFWDHQKATSGYFKIVLRVLYTNVSWKYPDLWTRVFRCAVWLLSFRGNLKSVLIISKIISPNKTTSPKTCFMKQRKDSENWHALWSKWTPCFAA